MTPLTLRPEQARIVAYRGGKLAVNAVPGSGKTFTLAALAVELIANTLPPESEVLVVTFTNSAVDNIRKRIRERLKSRGLPDVGYRVLTLHSLANTILRERPDLAGLSDDYRLDDELSGERTIQDAVSWVMNVERGYWESFLPSSLSARQREEALEHWRDATRDLGEEVVRLAKNLRLRSDKLAALLRAHSGISPFLELGAKIYQRYEQVLQAAGRVDFDDLVWGAVRALDNDDAFRERLGKRWLFILEDEAQDSTPLQEEILARLAKDHGNWVRVGDANQAIMTTFTTANVRFFRDFCERPDVTALPLSVSGRSAQPIIDLANALVEWATQHHPEPIVRKQALSAHALIRPAPPGDAQQNPAPETHPIVACAFGTQEEEVKHVARSAANYVLKHPDRTCAVLAPTNAYGLKVVAELAAIQSSCQRPIYQDQLRNAQPVRDVARVLGAVVRFCAAPARQNALADLLREVALRVPALMPFAEDKALLAVLRSVSIEQWLFPSPNASLTLPPNVVLSQAQAHALRHLTSLAARWLRASLLPVDQLILTAAQDLLQRENEFAIAHSIAISLRRYVVNAPAAQLADAAMLLHDIAANQRRYLSNTLIEAGFEPIPGQVTVTTMHKAKGLEWDRVYLVGTDELEFPHDPEGRFRGQLWYLNGHDPRAEARKVLEHLHAGLPIGDPRVLIREAYLEYIAERLRLLYVGITRARRALRFSFARERNGQPNQLALALRALNIPLQACH
ncbi:MAG: ATP-dependent helicase [Thermoflexales bacterium]|nr:ATP-dependent helicase [Thermoflexales bacterium]MCS7325586.1 ATP-dependent helicase [Thermoflexales bacterium]MDW8053145.1 ATP-dependent helicase [Anaerolineae bacterium]MDW8291797.1 ATP-dependent helicase [Anaerolineae bacterium]